MYTVHVHTSARSFDELHLHIECADDIYARIQADEMYREVLEGVISVQIGRYTSLVWSHYETTPVAAESNMSSRSVTDEDKKQYEDIMSAKVQHAMSFMESAPAVVFYRPGKLPRNNRTGKVPKFVDHRK